MKRTVIGCFLILFVASACAGPSEQQVAAARTIVEAYEAGHEGISDQDYQVALEVIRAHEDGGWDWLELGLAVGGVMLGTPMLGRRGWRIAKGVVAAARRRDLVGVAAGIPALVGLASEGAVGVEPPPARQKEPRLHKM